MTTSATVGATTIGDGIAARRGRPRRPSAGPWEAHALPLGKLWGLTPALRQALRRRGVATCGRLLALAGDPAARARLARADRVDPAALLALVRRADMARVAGVGTIFGLMLEEVGVPDVAALAAEDPAALQARLHAYNRQERLTRRSPTLEEVGSWVRQARALPPLNAGGGGAAGGDGAGRARPG